MEALLFSGVNGSLAFPIKRFVAAVAVDDLRGLIATLASSQSKQKIRDLLAASKCPVACQCVAKIFFLFFCFFCMFRESMMRKNVLSAK